MIEKLQDKDIIICNHSIKKYILKEISNNKKLLNIKIYSKKEFLNLLYGTPSKESLYFLMKHYNYSYSYAKEILDNIFIPKANLSAIKDILDSNNLIIYNNINIKRIILIDTFLDKYILDRVSNYEIININSNNYIHKVYRFNKDYYEVSFVAASIRELLKKNIPLNKIFLVNVSDTYYLNLSRIFKFFKIPINIYTKKSIYNTIDIKNFLKEFKDTKDIKLSLDKISNIDIKNKVIDILNDYTFITDLDILYSILEEEIKKSYIKVDTLDNAVNIINIEDMINVDNYYYIMNFNDTVVPSSYSDNLYIKDKDRIKYGMFTSIDNLNNEKTMIKKKLSSIPNIIITYKEKDAFNEYYPSILIKELSYVVEEPNIDIYRYSDTFNNLELSKYLDNYIKYNEYNSNIDRLYNTYKDNLYNTYDNTFTNVSFDDLEKYLKGSINLSYSSMNNYYLCAFRFYINNILKLDTYEDTFAIFIGHLFHYCLSKMYEDNFNLESVYKEYLTKRNLTNKEKFYCDNLYSTLDSIINVIKNQESYSDYNNTLTEKIVNIDYPSKLNVRFLGFIDKIKYLEKDNKLFVSIIDYKTGSIKTTLDNINYGMHLQLPVYVYLAKRMDKNVKITGFYLQNILNNPSIDALDSDKEFYNKLKLDGYSIDNEEQLALFDKSYTSSVFIKGMSKTDKGFGRYAKILSDKDINTITDIVEDKIKEVILNIEDGTFPINPKRIDNELVGCTYCPYKDICYRREENIVDLENKTKDDILGGSYAKVD